jgi:hypothetical protein
MTREARNTEALAQIKIVEFETMKTVRTGLLEVIAKDQHETLAILQPVFC